LRSAGFKLPAARITVNLAPADRRKDGSAYDLPLAMGLLEATALIPAGCLKGWFMAGEPSLNGELKSVPGILPLAVLARDEQARAMIVPAANAEEAAVAQGLPVFAANGLQEALDIVLGRGESVPHVPAPPLPHACDLSLDFAEVKGQEHAKRAIEIAAAGAHNLLLIGPPGSGKTMLAQRIPTVLPPLTFDEALEVTRIYSVAGMLEGKGLVRTRPFRAPHHTISQIALIGGGSHPRPGEVSLAHRGVLFLDELPEYQKAALEVLRQPLEDGRVTVSRAVQSVTFPAGCMLIAAMNPCPCGYYSDPRHTCSCSPQQIERYRARLSGPLLDRIDLHIEVPAVPFEDLRSRRPGADSASMRERIRSARAAQDDRYARTPCSGNAELSGSLLETHCRLGREEREFLREAMRNLALSARAYTRILRISRTIADLEQAAELNVSHLAEAINCRILDREHIR
jgi:magnesium chelatase family protein